MTLQDHVKPFVHQTRSTKSLHFCMAEIQSCMDLAHPDALLLEYTRTMMGFLLFHPMVRRIAMIGLGGGSLAKFCFRHLPLADITVLEINRHVIASRHEFAVPADDERFRVIRTDGARYVRAHEGAFDVLLVDGYDYDGLPGPLSSKRFYDDAFDCLRTGGVMVANLHLGTPDFQLLLARIQRSFNGPPLVAKDADDGNAIVFARKDRALWPGDLEAVVRPGTLDDAQWTPLQAAFGRVRQAHRERSS